MNDAIKNWTDIYHHTTTRRRKEINELLLSHNITTDDEDPILLMVLNRGFRYLFFNFLCSLDHHGISEVKQRILVIPTDRETEKEIDSVGGIMTFFPSFLGETLLNVIDASMPRLFALGAHRWAISLQIAFVTDLVELGYNVLLQDADVVWFGNAFEYLKQPRFDRLDLQMSVDDRRDFRGPFNSGCIWIKSGCKTKVFMETMMHLIGLVIVGRSDQLLWNMLIQENVFRQIHVETLSDRFFMGGYQIDVNRSSIQKGWILNTALLLHVSWTDDQWQKLEKLAMAE